MRQQRPSRAEDKQIRLLKKRKKNAGKRKQVALGEAGSSVDCKGSPSALGSQCKGRRKEPVCGKVGAPHPATLSGNTSLPFILHFIAIAEETPILQVIDILLTDREQRSDLFPLFGQRVQSRVFRPHALCVSHCSCPWPGPPESKALLN